MEDERNVTSDERERAAGATPLEIVGAVIRPLASRMAARADAGENVAIGQGLRRDLEYGLDVAASLIERLAADNETMRKGLKPFAEAAEHLHPSQADHALTLDGISVWSWRQAYAAYHGGHVPQDAKS